MNRRTFIQLLLISLAGCAVPPPAAVEENPTQGGGAGLEPTPTRMPTACVPGPLAVPTRPARIPATGELDELGLHSNGSKIVDLDPDSYRLKLSGLVDYPLELSLADLRCMPKITARPNLTCKGNFEDVTTWSGVPLSLVLARAGGIQPAAKAVYLVGGDKFESFVSIEDARREDNYLAYEWEGQPLPLLHGFPLRSVMPSLLGYTWIKYLVEIRVE